MHQTKKQYFKPAPFWNGECARVTRALWAPDGEHPNPAASQPIADAIVRTVDAKRALESETEHKTKMKTKETNLAKKMQHREEERSKLVNEAARKKYDADAAKSDHRSAASSAHTMAKDDAGRRCRKTAIFPTPAQTERLRLWLDAVRYVKNLAIVHINTTHVYAKKALRKVVGIVKGDSFRNHVPARFADVPRVIIDDAVRDVGKDCTSRLAQLGRATSRKTWAAHFKAMRARGDKEIEKAERGAIKKEIKIEIARQKATWTFAFNRKKDRTESMLLSGYFLNLGDSAGFHELFGGPKTRGIMKTGPKDRLPETFESDCRLIHDKWTKRFHMCITNPMPKPNIQGPRPPARVVSIDPGVRTFVTCINPTTGIVSEYGKAGRNQAHGLESRVTEKSNKQFRRTWGVADATIFLARKAKRVAARGTSDWVASRMAEDPRERRRLAQRAGRKRGAAARIRQRSSDLVAAMHWRIANELCRTADVILLPDFRPSGKVTKLDPRGRPRKLGRKTVSKMLGLSHAKFRERLLSKAEEFGVCVEIVREDYTTRTCGRCGHDHENIGVKKVFTCPKCHWTLGRDANGARNVMIRYIIDNGIETVLG